MRPCRILPAALVSALACVACGSGAAGRSVPDLRDRPRLDVLDHQWSVPLGGAGVATAAEVTMAPGPAGDTPAGTVVVAGWFEDTLDLEAPTGTLRRRSRGQSDAFVAGLDPAGAFRWTHTWGGPGHDAAVAVAANRDRIAVGLRHTTPVTVGGHPLPGTDRSAVADDGAAVIVLAPDGAVIRVHALASSAHVRIASVAVAADGTVAVAGAFAGTLDIGARGERVLTSAGSTDAFAASFAPDGALRWATRAGGPGADSAQDIVQVATGTDSDSDSKLGAIAAVLVGTFASPVELDAAHTAAPGAFVLHLDPTGRPAWVRTLGQDTAAHAVAASPTGALYVAGHFHRLLSLAPDTHSDPHPTQGSADAFVARLDPAGVPVWSVPLGGPGSDHAQDLALAGDSLVVTGTFADRATAGGRTLTSAGAHDLFLAVLSAEDGTITATRALGGPAEDAAGGIAVSDRRTMVLTGSFADTATFGGGAPVRAPGPRSAFVASFGL